MLILPIWLWLLLGAIAAVVYVVQWTCKVAITDRRAAAAVSVGKPLSDAALDQRLLLAVAEREMTVSERMSAERISPLEVVYDGDRARTPISMVITERTLVS